MKIQKSVYEAIISAIPCVPPESGGIIGGTNQLVTHFALDNGTFSSNRDDTYVPNTLFLNEIIKKWKQKGVAFYGLFHSHYPDVTWLSNGDKRYIAQIMEAMPHNIERLYFPIILPMENIIVYRADRIGEKVYFASEDIEVI